MGISAPLLVHNLDLQTDDDYDDIDHHLHHEYKEDDHDNYCNG